MWRESRARSEEDRTKGTSNVFASPLIDGGTSIETEPESACRSQKVPFLSLDAHLSS